MRLWESERDSLAVIDTGSSVSELAWNAAGDRLAVGQKNAIQIYDATTGNIAETILPPSGP